MFEIEHLSRRRLLQGTVLAVAGIPLIAQETGPSLKFPTAPRERLSVTSYPFRAYIESPTNRAREAAKRGMDLKEFPAMIAREFGVYNINPLGDHLNSLDAGYLDSFRKAVSDARSHVVDLGLGARDFSSADESVREEAVSYGSKWIDIAAVIGSPSVRQHLKSATGAPSEQRAAESLAHLADYGAKKNVVVNLENDSPGAEDPFFIIGVVERAQHPYLRALPDFGNSLRGHDAAYNERAVDGMLKHAFNMCHVKDVLRDKGGTERKVDIERMFALAKANHYAGYFSMEFDTATGDAFEGTRRLVSESLRYLGAS